MMPTVAELPDDVDTLKAMVLATVEQRASMEAENRRIASEIAALKLINIGYANCGADGDRQDV
jgi:hypothetical protein